MGVGCKLNFLYRLVRGIQRCPSDSVRLVVWKDTAEVSKFSNYESTMAIASAFICLTPKQRIS